MKDNVRNLSEFDGRIPAEFENKKPVDTLRRPLRDLRISVTDRCNFRCVYCMPKAHFGMDHQFVSREKLLSFEEITRAVKVFANLGVEKLRITGGEPLIRRNIEKLISQLSSIKGIRDICMTTNGALLTPAKAKALKESGLSRITVSLDALENALFTSLTGVNIKLDRVLAGIENALAAGLWPVKVNMVVMKDTNESEILKLVRRFRGGQVIPRFIEFMDVGNHNGWATGKVVTAAEIIEIIQSEFPLEPLAPSYTGEVASRWGHADGSGEIGVISSVSQPFCSSCNRARLSAEGQLHTCLFSTQGHDLRTQIRADNTDDALAGFITGIWHQREDRYSETRGRVTQVQPRIEMSYIGG